MGLLILIIGNRTSGGTVTGVNNQLLNDGTYAYQYDGEGNRTRRTEISTGKVTEYVWDYRNRLASVLFKDAGGVVTKTIDYIYDGNNQRIGKRIDGAVVERYVIDRNQIALVFDGNGNQTHRYLYGTAVDQVLADETGASTNWLLGDNQGTIRDVVDSNGSLINHVVYDSFGKVQSQSNVGYELRFGYTGREQDGETGLDYYRARYYDASNGRFISEDPIGFGGGDGNLSRYVGNSPTNFIDPSGLRPVRPLNDGAGIDWRGISLPPSGGSVGGGNARPTLPYRPSVDPRFRSQPSDRGTPNYGVPSNSTLTPGNNPDIPNPNKCAIFEEYTSKLQEKIVAQGNTTENKKCKYAYIIPADTLSRGSQYARYVSRSVYELGVVDLQTGNVAIYDGITPNTTNVWEAKSYLESEAIRVRSVHQRSFGGIRNFNDAEKKIYNKSIPRLPEQANRSVEVAKKCGFNLNYAVNSKNLKQFVQEDLQNFPRRGIEKFPKINVLYKPMPGIENIQ